MVRLGLAYAPGDTPLYPWTRLTRGAMAIKTLDSHMFRCEQLALPCEQSSFDYLLPKQLFATIYLAFAV
jgi:hypothetical protein